MPRVSSETSNEEQQLMEQKSLIKARDKERRKSAKKAEKRKKERANEKHRLRKKRSRERDSQAKKERLQSIRIKPTSSHRRSPEPFMVKVADPVVLLLGMTSTHCPELEACQPRALNANQIMEELVALERQGHFSSEGNSSTPMLFRDEARRMLASKLSGFHCIASADKYPGGSVLHANF